MTNLFMFVDISGFKEEQSSDKLRTKKIWSDGLWREFEYDIKGRIIRDEYSDGKVFNYFYIKNLIACKRPEGCVQQVYD